MGEKFGICRKAGPRCLPALFQDAAGSIKLKNQALKMNEVGVLLGPTPCRLLGSIQEISKHGQQEKEHEERKEKLHRKKRKDGSKRSSAHGTRPQNAGRR